MGFYSGFKGLILCNLDTSTMRWLKPEAGCCARVKGIVGLYCSSQKEGNLTSSEDSTLSICTRTSAFTQFSALSLNARIYA